MDSFIERFCAKYYFPYAEGRQLIEGMEYIRLIVKVIVWYVRENVTRLSI